MLLYYGRELICIIALILTTYASIQNSPPKVAKYPAPTPFFTKGSLVSDWPAGNLAQTQTRVSLSELSLVFYYAPWCAESQHARAAYEHVARLYYRDAHFAAINCWQPGGECRLQYSKVQSWPVLMAYQPNGLAVQYHGPWTNAALSKFVLSLVNPLQRLSDPEDLLQMMTGKDAIVTAFIDTNLNAKEYKIFYQTSLKWLEKDPFQEIGFSVVTGESVAKFGVEVTPTIRIYLWNETIEYNGNSSWKSINLTKWIHNHVQCVSMWISPPGSVKSSSIAPYLKHGPILLFFTPRNLYSETSDAYSMLRQIGMEYYNCPNDNWVKEMAKEYIMEQRKDNLKTLNKLREDCSELFKRQTPTNSDDEFTENCIKTKPISISLVNVLNSSKFVDGKHKTFELEKNYCDIIGPKYETEFYQCSSQQQEDFGSDKTCSSGKFYRKTDDEIVKTSMLNSEFDFRSPENILKQHFRRKCTLLYLSELHGDNSNLFFEHSSEENDNLELIAGLACKTNRTISIMAIDSNLYHVFAERLGVDVLNAENKTRAVIVDHDNESTYVLNNKITINSLVKFIYDFTKGSLQRFKRSNNLNFENTHYFDLNIFHYENNRLYETRFNDYHTDGIKLQANQSSILVKDKNRNDFHREHIFMREINSHEFNEIVINSNKTVIVFFYSSQCAFCNLLTQNLLQISKILRQQPNLDFVRIDGDKNDLNWEFSMELYPSLIIFPNGRKSESRIFSVKNKVNIQNIIGFILSNLDRPMRLHAILLICNNSKRQISHEDCLNVLENEISENISSSLREWRKFQHKRRSILRRLQLLKKIYLILLSFNNKNHSSCDYNLLVNDIKSIIKIWKV
uniref:Putative thioredoxin-like protein n=1 Tax=Corethrella appendiculata TaxID=1370023 RepID=U5ESM9_9DIPT